MFSTLELEEKNCFHDCLHFGHHKMEGYSIFAEDLVEPNRLRLYLVQIGSFLNSPSLVVTASQFAKRYSYLVLLPSLYAMSVLNKGLDFRLTNCTLVTSLAKHAYPKIHLADETVVIPQAEERHYWRDNILRTIFAEHIAPLWKTLHEVTGIPLRLLWENASVYVYWLYEKKVKDISHPRLEEDFHYLISNRSAHLFSMKSNPLRRVDPTGFRKTCCLYYCLSQENTTCSNCPKNQVIPNKQKMKIS